MADQICMAERVSKCRAINSDQDRCHVTFRKAYEWATLGGARGIYRLFLVLIYFSCGLALGMDDKIGSLEVGKRFDALIVDTTSFPDYITEDETEDQIFERFIRCGSSNNIVEVFVDGVSRVKQNEGKFRSKAADMTKYTRM